jgi:uncharacterized DUF497 family protein
VRVQWDENKNRANIAKHGIDFNSVVPVFDDPLSMTIPDRVVNGEHRYRTIGAAPTRHGMLAQSVVLPSESDAGFTALLADLLDEFQPETPSEVRLIEIMAVADWRRSRLWCLEMA